MMHRMFTVAGSFLINHVPTLIIGRGLHSALHALNQSNIFRLKHGVDLANSLHFFFSRMCSLKEKIKLLVGFLRACRNKAPHHEILATRISHQGSPLKQ